MLVSVFSDGSFCRHKLVGGWGAFIKSNRGSLFRGGPLRGRVNTSLEAEVLAAVNAIHLAVSTEIAVEGDLILLQSDCTDALDILTLVGRSGTARCRYAKKLTNRLLMKKGIALNVRHVKGHQRSLEPRFKVNNICDEMAKEGMNEMRKKGWK